MGKNVLNLENLEKLDALLWQAFLDKSHQNEWNYTNEKWKVSQLHQQR